MERDQKIKLIVLVTSCETMSSGDEKVMVRAGRVVTLHDLICITKTTTLVEMLSSHKQRKVRGHMQMLPLLVAT